MCHSYRNSVIIQSNIRSRTLIAFFIPLLYCIVILSITYFFIHNTIQVQLTKIIAFGAGFLSTFVLFEILPHTLTESISLPYTLLLIVIGFCINAVAERWILPRLRFLNQLLPTTSHKCSEHDATHIHYHLLPPSMGCSAMGCFILCAFFDGIRLNSGLLINPQATFMISLGLLFHLLPESITIVGIGLSSGFSRKAITGIVAIFCLALMAGSVSFLTLSNLHTVENITLALATGLFIYVCSIHLIPVTIKIKQTKWFLMGIGICLLLSLIARLIPIHGPVGIH